MPIYTKQIPAQDFEDWCAQQRRRILGSLRNVEPRMRRAQWSEGILLQRDKKYLTLERRGQG